MPAFDLAASKEAATRQDAEGAVKIREDLDRYAAAIAKGQPELVIECGTWTGMSALWFARHGLDVITIDTNHGRVLPEPRAEPRITFLTGDSADRDVAGFAAGLVRGRRTMVALDSEHSGYHVRREIDLYGPLVTPGCHLVAEDGIVRWLGLSTGPLDAIEAALTDDPGWERDQEIEDMYPVSMNPMGWWERVA